MIEPTLPPSVPLPESVPAKARRRQGGFTLLEIMIALAVLAVGAVCVLSTFAAAIALHVRRENAVRQRLVVEEATVEAQAVFDAHIASKGRELPPPIDNRTFSRDDLTGWSVTFVPVDGVDSRVAVRARIDIVEEDSRGRKKERVEWAFLDRAGVPAMELKTSESFEKEKKDEEAARRSGGTRNR